MYCSPRTTCRARWPSIILLFCRWWKVRSERDSFDVAILSCWFSPQFPAIWDNRIRVHAIGMSNRHYILLFLDWRFSRQDHATNQKHNQGLLLVLYMNKKNCLVFTWKMTTRPPLSPVAKSSPSWLNSTQDMISASVTSSSNAPLICEKHQDASPLPVKRNGKPKLYKIFLISCPHLPFSISIAKPNCLLHLISSR